MYRDQQRSASNQTGIPQSNTRADRSRHHHRRALVTRDESSDSDVDMMEIPRDEDSDDDEMWKIPFFRRDKGPRHPDLFSVSLVTPWLTFSPIIGITDF